MAFFDFLRKKEASVKQEEERSLGLGLGFNNISSYANTQSMRLSAVYAATNMISNSCALIPMKVLSTKGGRRKEVENHSLNMILNLSPNSKHNHFNFFKLLIESVILKGNGYAYIERDGNLNVKALHLINPDFVNPVITDDGIKYLVNGMDKAIDAINMIHLYQHLDDTFRGISTIKYADMALSGAYNAEKHSDNFFKSGAGLMGVLKSSAPMTNEQKKQVAESWSTSIKNTLGGGVAILPQGLDFQSISVSPEDSQLLDVRKYNVIEIARFFNISPVKLFDYSNVSYSTLEQTSMSYLQDTILPFTQLMEDEFNRKLFKPSEVGKYSIDFDYSVLVQTDKTSEAEYYNKLLTNGILSVNDVRAKLGYEPIPAEEGGDAHFIQISYGTVKNVVDGVYVKQTAQTQNQKLDNKVINEEKTTEENNTEKE
jgi:HK97 family phage portal protein